MRRHPHEPIYTDPVCGMKLSHNTTAEELKYEGKTYYCCARFCREAFEAKAEKYIHHHRRHGMRRS